MSDDEQDLREAPPARLDVDVVRAEAAPVEMRAAEGEESRDDNSPGTMVGHFSTFGDWYEINSYFEGHFIERIAPGAFKRTINNRSGETPIRVLLDHGFDPELGDKPLGVPDVLEEREGGPYAEVPLFDGVPQIVVSGLRAGAYGQSFRFQVLRDQWVEPDAENVEPVDNPRWSDLPQRTIQEVRVSEFGPTPFPANPAADAGLRSDTDRFYEQLRRRSPQAYDDAVARTQAVRLPLISTRTDASASITEDPPVEHSVDPSETRHSEDPPEQHSPAPAIPTPTPITERTEVMDETMTVEERVARQAEIRTRLSELDAEHAGGEMGREARATWDALEAEYDQHQRAIEDIERRREALRARAEAHPEQGERPATGPAVHVTGSRRVDNIYDLTAIRHQARSMDDLANLYRENARRAIDVARFPGVKDADKARAQVNHLLDTVDDEDGTLARRILTTGSPTYERAFGKALTKLGTGGLTSEEQRALALGTDSAGGYAVPFQLDPTVILTSDGVIDPLRAMSRTVQITGKEWQGITSAGVTVSRSNEGAEAGENNPTFDQPTVRTERVTGFVPFSIEIEATWNQMRSEVTAILADAKATEEATAFLTGNGTPPNPEGLLTKLAATAGSLVPVATANTFAVGDLFAVEEALAPRHRSRAQWLTTRSIYNKVRQFDSAGGANLWVRLGDGLGSELLGYPARESSEMPTALNVDTNLVVVFGDFNKFLIVDRIGMSVELVPHLIGANRRPTGQRGIFAVWHNSCLVLDANAFRALTGNDGV